MLGVFQLYVIPATDPKSHLRNTVDIPQNEVDKKVVVDAMDSKCELTSRTFGIHPMHEATGSAI